MKSPGFWEGVIYGQGMRLVMLSDVQWLRPLATVQEAPEKPVEPRHAIAGLELMVYVCIFIYLYNLYNMLNGRTNSFFIHLCLVIEFVTHHACYFRSST